MKTEISRTISVLRNMAAGIIVKCLTLVLNFVTKTIFVKLLGIQYTGVSSLFTDILAVLSLAELGIGSAITYALYKPVAENDGKQIAKLMNFYKIAYRIVAFIVFSVGMILVPFLKYLVTDVPDIKENITFIYILYLLKSVCSYLLVYKSVILTAKQKKYEISQIEGAMAVIKLLVECVALLAFRQFLAYLAVDIFLTVLQNVLVSERAGKEYDSKIGARREKLNRDERKEIYADIKALAMYQISGVCLAGTDSIVISSMLGTGMVGFLSYYKMILNSITAIMQQFFNAANASVGNLAVEEKAEKQYQLFKGLNFAVFWVSAFCSVSLYLLQEPFVEIWLGQEYLLGEGIILALVLDFFISNMVRSVALFRISNGLFVQGRYRPVVMSVFNVILSILLAYQHGLFGVLIATVIARALTQVWYDPWLVYRQVFHRDVREYYKNYICYLLVITASIWIIKALNMFMGVTNIYVLFIMDIVLCLLVPNGLIIMCWHRTEEFRECMRRAGKIIGVVKERRGKGEKDGG